MQSSNATRVTSSWWVPYRTPVRGATTKPGSPWLFSQPWFAVVAVGWLSMLVAAMLAAGLMLMTGCCSASAARRNVDWSVLIVIAAALGIGRAIEQTGAASLVAETLMKVGGHNPLVALAIVYGLTSLFTEIITNNAAAALLFPIATATAAQLDVNPMPFIFAIMIAASASFATPLGYQTNLMV